MLSQFSSFSLKIIKFRNERDFSDSFLLIYPIPILEFSNVDELRASTIAFARNPIIRPDKRAFYLRQTWNFYIDQRAGHADTIALSCLAQSMIRYRDTGSN